MFEESVPNGLEGARLYVYVRSVRWLPACPGRRLVDGHGRRRTLARARSRTRASLPKGGDAMARKDRQHALLLALPHVENAAGVPSERDRSRTATN